MAEGEDVLKGLKSFHSLPCFNTYLRQSYYVDVFNKGASPLKWKASVTENWILLSKKAGETATEERIEVSVDWAKVPVGEKVFGVLEITSDRGEKENVYISVFNPSSPSLVEMDTFEQGSVDVYTYVLPTFVTSKDRGYAGHEATNIETKYGVCIDEGPVLNPSTSSFEYAQIWYESVLKNCRINKTTLHIDKPGKHTVKIICGDAGTVLQKIVLDFGGMKRSYFGPQPTRK